VVKFEISVKGSETLERQGSVRRATMDFFVAEGVEISIQHRQRPSIRLKDEE
jgi:hypothetical protein